MSHRLFRYAKLFSLIGGFVFGMAGAVWSFAFDQRLGQDQARLSDLKADLSAQIRMLNDIASEYFMANQQGDLIFVTAHQDTARRDLAELIYKGSMLDRATPVRNMIGALAIAKVLDYRTTYDAYAKLNDEARANLTLDTFMKVKQAERTIITKGQERVPVLMKALFEVERELNANAQAQGRNRVIGLFSSLLGSFLLLLANLVAARQERQEAPIQTAAPDAPSNP